MFSSPCTAFSLAGMSFEEHLAARMGWSLDRFLTVFDDFLRDVLDRTFYLPVIVIVLGLKVDSSAYTPSGTYASTFCSTCSRSTSRTYACDHCA